MSENTQTIPNTEGINLPDPESMAKDCAERPADAVMQADADVIIGLGDLIDAFGEFALANREHFKRACAYRDMIETIERRWESGSADPKRDVGAARPGRRAKKDTATPNAPRPGHSAKKS